MQQLARLSNAVAVIAGWLLLLLSITVCTEVISRKFFSFSFQSADELGGYIVAISSVAGFASALVSRAHTRVDIFWSRFPEGTKAVLNVLALLALTGFSVYMTYHAWLTLSQSHHLGSRSFTPLQTPLWMPQAIWFAGLTFFAAATIFVTFATIRASLRDPAAANDAYGPPSSEKLNKVGLGGPPSVGADFEDTHS